MKKFEEALTTCNMEDDEYTDDVDNTDQHDIHSNDAVEEPEGEIVKSLGIAD